LSRSGVNPFKGGFAFASASSTISLRQKDFVLIEGRPGAVLKILIVEDDFQLATTLKYLVEDNPRYRVIATANDLDSAVAAATDHMPDLALVDLRLANGTTGFSVAVRMGDFDVPCFFITGKAPDFPMPDLALGCLMKPFTAEDIHRSLAAAEDIMRGREALRPKMPVNLMLYDKVDEEGAEPQPGFIPSKRSLKTRIEHWISGTQH
jgi:DNA-binding NarL/FixJ family response regulator